jgi:hypothetical protein
MAFKINWQNVRDGEFEEIVAALLRAMGYQNVIVRTGGSDDGWDIDAELVRPLPDGSIETAPWRIECKRYKGAPSAEAIRDHYQRMFKTPPICQNLLFVVSGALTNPTKKDLEEFGKRDLVSVKWWEGNQLQTLIEKHLSSRELRAQITPHVELELPRDALVAACRHQVAAEIQRRVGRKYLPDIFHTRPIEEEIGKFIEQDLDRTQLLELGGSLKRFKHPDLAVSLREQGAGLIECVARAKDWAEAQEPISTLVSLCEGKTKQSLLHLVRGVRCLRRNCFLVKDKAGSGKTNVLCRLATDDARSGTVSLFFSCKFDLPATKSLEEVILGAVSAAFTQAAGGAGRLLAGFAEAKDFLRALLLTLEKESLQLVVYLDGINENRDLSALDEAIGQLLMEWNGFPVKFVVTCRDIFWTFFSANQWQRFLYGEAPHELPEFADFEVDQVIGAYFQKFEIGGSLTGTAREKCRHPLLLRFFCEAHKGRDIHEFRDLRLKDLFEEYWRRKSQEIAELLGLGADGGMRVESFLFSLVEHMLDRFATQIALRDVPQITGEKDIESNRSIYKHLLDQDIILEESPPESVMDKSYLARRISFVYDEFYDYMMSLAYVRRRNWDALGPKEICADFARLMDHASTFEQLRGVAEYLVLMAEDRGIHQPLCAVLGRLGNAELLCKILPKLKGDTDWMDAVLGRCLVTCGAWEEDRSRARKATGRASPEHEVGRLIEKTASEQLYDVLVRDWI